MGKLWLLEDVIEIGNNTDEQSTVQIPNYRRGVENMPNFYDRLKSGAKAAVNSFGPGRYSAGGVNIVCSHCKHYEFQESVAQLSCTKQPHSDPRQ